FCWCACLGVAVLLVVRCDKGFRRRVGCFHYWLGFELACSNAGPEIYELGELILSRRLCLIPACYSASSSEGNPMATLKSEVVPKNSGAAFEVKKGQRLRIAGKSIVDFVAFNLHDLCERFDQART